jgi:hypothetical protein
MKQTSYDQFRACILANDLPHHVGSLFGGENVHAILVF